MNRGRGRSPPDIEELYSLKVDNLSYRTNLEDLMHTFEKFGKVGDIYIPRDPYSHESRGFAFVRFMDKRDADDAMESMDGRRLDGRELRVAFAKYGRPRNDRRQQYNGYSGRRRERSHERRDRRSRSRDRRRRTASRSNSPPARRRRDRSADSPPKESRRSKRSVSRSRSRSVEDNRNDSAKDIDVY